VGTYLALVRYAPGKAEKPAAWELAVVQAFFERLTEAAMKEKADNALKSLMGGDTEDK
jgi:hypothetical protein